MSNNLLRKMQRRAPARNCREAARAKRAAELDSLDASRFVLTMEQIHEAANEAGLPVYICLAVQPDGHIRIVDFVIADGLQGLAKPEARRPFPNTVEPPEAIKAAVSVVGGLAHFLPEPPTLSFLGCHPDLDLWTFTMMFPGWNVHGEGDSPTAAIGAWLNAMHERRPGLFTEEAMSVPAPTTLGECYFCEQSFPREALLRDQETSRIFCANCQEPYIGAQAAVDPLTVDA